MQTCFQAVLEAYGGTTLSIITLYVVFFPLICHPSATLDALPDTRCNSIYILYTKEAVLSQKYSIEPNVVFNCFAL